MRMMRILDWRPKDVWSYYATTGFSDMVDFAVRHSDLEGVSGILERGMEAQAKYEEIREQTIGFYQPKIDSAFADYLKADKAWRLARTLLRAAVAVFAACEVLNFTLPADARRTSAPGPIWMVVDIVCAGAGPLAVAALAAVALVCRHASRKGVTAYLELSNDAWEIQQWATSQAWESSCRCIRDIDTMYISSLPISDDVKKEILRWRTRDRETLQRECRETVCEWKHQTQIPFD